MILFTNCPICEKPIRNDVFIDQDIETKETYFELTRVDQTCKHKLREKTLLDKVIREFEEVESNLKYYNPELD